MGSRRAGLTAIILLFLCTLVCTFTYGPSQRTFVLPDKVTVATTARDIDLLWHDSGVHGRIAVIFARDFNKQASGTSFPEIDFLDTALRQGIVRRAYYIVPDGVWSQVVEENIFGRELIVPLKTTDTGFTVLHDGGRIHFMPLSKFTLEVSEKVLAVIDPALWSPPERFRIDKFFSSGLLSSDLLISIRENAGDH